MYTLRYPACAGVGVSSLRLRTTAYAEQRIRSERSNP